MLYSHDLVEAYSDILFLSPKKQEVKLDENLLSKHLKSPLEKSPLFPLAVTIERLFRTTSLWQLFVPKIQ